MSTLTALPSPPRKPNSPQKQSHRKTQRSHGPRHSPSPPSSPPRRVPMPNMARQEPSRSYSLTQGTFLEDSTPTARTREPASPSREDGEDPHDLSFSSDLPPRASMVENMALALDQFSSGLFNAPTSSYSTQRLERYETAQKRVRGHTLSSSVSSEGDLRDLRSMSNPAPPVNRNIRRGSVKHRQNVSKLPSIFGEDEDSVRIKVYDAQRAEDPLKKKGPRKNRSNTHKSNSSAASSIDLGHLAAFQGRLGPAGNRRSRSFDFGSRSRPSHQLTIDPQGPEAPTPVVFAGPDAQSSPTRATFQAQPVVRKNSTRSSKSAHTRKGRTGTLGTNTLKSKGGEALPPMPTKTGHTASGPSLEIRSTQSHHDLSWSKPGFFRRVFGSSKTNLVSTDLHAHPNHTSTHDSYDRPLGHHGNLDTPASPPSKAKRTSTDLSANKEIQPTVAKKPSSFFRRRKKSVSNNVPPPLPLTLAQLNAPPGEPSPVSSLRAFMDPYINNDASPAAGHRRSNSNQSFRSPMIAPADDSLPRLEPRLGTVTETAARTDSQASRRAIDQAPQRPTLLMVPHQDSFLADSSSIEDLSRRSTRPASPATTSDVLENDSKANADVKASASTPSVKAPLEVLRRPIIPDRQQSWPSDRGSKPAIRPAERSRTTPELVNGDSNASSTLDVAQKGASISPSPAPSDPSEYRSAPSTPIDATIHTDPSEIRVSPNGHMSRQSESLENRDVVAEKAQKIYDNADDSLDHSQAAAWLGEDGFEREKIRSAFMELFDFTHFNILVSLRRLCDRIVLKGETQQMDRLLLAFSQRWCTCNPTHGFKSTDVVHTICYSILLLNTDLHLADIGQKMTKNQFVRNALPTIKRVLHDENSDTIREDEVHSPAPELGRRNSILNSDIAARFQRRPIDRLNREDSGDIDANATGGPLIESPYGGSERGWESQVEAVLRSFYSSISQEPLPLFGSQADSTPTQQSNNFLSVSGGVLRRTPSVLSKPNTVDNRSRPVQESKSVGARWMTKARSRPRLPSAPGFGSSRTSLDESSAWSPSMSSTWSKNSLGKTLTSMSVDSFGTEVTAADYQSSIGFANALSQAIIRDDQFELSMDEGIKAAPFLDDESLELSGAPWAKEGILKHKCHLEGVDKRSKDRNWNDCFAVIERGWMRLFSFSMTAKSLRSKAKNQKPGGVVGGGNWQDNAEEVWKFVLRHAIASALPPPGYSKSRPYVWALSLPTGAVHLFSVGTPDIVREFVSTANFWSARLSKEPMMGGVSNMEYGWSENVINRALINSDSSRATSVASPRPSTQLSLRSSIDQHGGAKSKLAGDRAYINEWNPPQQSMFASQLLEVDQLKALQTYVNNVEEELQKHNELRGPMQLAFSHKHPNAAKAMANWEKKSSYLLREIVKFRTYIDALHSAQANKEKIYKMRREEEENRQAAEESRQIKAELAALMDG